MVRIVPGMKVQYIEADSLLLNKVQKSSTVLKVPQCSRLIEVFNLVGIKIIHNIGKGERFTAQIATILVITMGTP